MAKPVRIQLRRTKGWRMPPNTVKVTRGLGRSGRFGNPFVPLERDEPTVRACVAAYRKLLTACEGDVMQMGTGSPGRGAFLVVYRRNVLDALPELRGKNLACWCPLDKPCHADVLLELANG